MLRIALTVWGGKRKTMRVILTGSLGPRGIPKYRCEVFNDIDQQGSQEKAAQHFDLDQKITEQIQLMLSDLNIKAVPPSTGRDAKGLHYLLKMEDGFQAATYVWSHNSPKGWKELQEFADLMTGLTPPAEK